MALTIGVRTYCTAADFRTLFQDAHFTTPLHNELDLIANDAERAQALRRARGKLEKWIKHETTGSVIFGSKGQIGRAHV